MGPCVQWALVFRAMAGILWLKNIDRFFKHESSEWQVIRIHKSSGWRMILSIHAHPFVEQKTWNTWLHLFRIHKSQAERHESLCWRTWITWLKDITWLSKGSQILLLVHIKIPLWVLRFCEILRFPKLVHNSVDFFTFQHFLAFYSSVWKRTFTASFESLQYLEITKHMNIGVWRCAIK